MFAKLVVCQFVFALVCDFTTQLRRISYIAGKYVEPAFPISPGFPNVDDTVVEGLFYVGQPNLTVLTAFPGRFHCPLVQIQHYLLLNVIPTENRVVLEFFFLPAFHFYVAAELLLNQGKKGILE